MNGWYPEAKENHKNLSKDVQQYLEGIVFMSTYPPFGIVLSKLILIHFFSKVEDESLIWSDIV